MNGNKLPEDESDGEGRSDDMESIESLRECDANNENYAERNSDEGSDDDDHVDEIVPMDNTSPNSDGIVNSSKRSLRPDEQQLDGDSEDDAVSRNLSGLNEGGDDEEDLEDQDYLAGSLPALRTYFYERLLQVILFLGGTADLVQGWRASVIKKEGGLTMGQLEIEYVTNGSVIVWKWPVSWVLCQVLRIFAA